MSRTAASFTLVLSLLPFLAGVSCQEGGEEGGIDLAPAADGGAPPSNMPTTPTTMDGAQAPMGMPKDPPPASTGTAYVKMCNTMADGIELQVGPTRLSAANGACGRCVPVPAGEVELVMHHKDQHWPEGKVTLAPNQSFAIVSTTYYPTRAVTLGQGASCTGTYHQILAEFPSDLVMPLEPFEMDGVVLPKPVGWQRVDSPPNTFLFQPATPSPTGLTTLDVRRTGGLPETTPEALQLLNAVVAKHPGARIVGQVDSKNGKYAGATIVLPRDGKEHFSHLGVLRFLGADNAIKLVTVEIGGATQYSLENSTTNAAVVAKTIAYLTIGTAPLETSQIQGKWNSVGSSGIDYVDPSSGNMTGNWLLGDGLVVEFLPNGEYKWFVLHYANCSGVAPCILEGSYAIWESGRYELTNGLVTFQRKSCIERFYDKYNQLQSSYLCDLGSVPLAAAVYLEDGKLVLASSSQSPLHRESFELSTLQRK